MNYPETIAASLDQIKDAKEKTIKARDIAQDQLQKTTANLIALNAQEAMLLEIRQKVETEQEPKLENNENVNQG